MLTWWPIDLGRDWVELRALKDAGIGRWDGSELQAGSAGWAAEMHSERIALTVCNVQSRASDVEPAAGYVFDDWLASADGARICEVPGFRTAAFDRSPCTSCWIAAGSLTSGSRAMRSAKLI